MSDCAFGNSPLSRLLKNSSLTEKHANISMNLRGSFQIHGFFIMLLGRLAVIC
jgi:hypothetical protein